LCGAADVDGGELHTCAVLGNGTVRCWGDNTYGQLGDGSKTAATTPIAVVGLAGAVAVAAGSSHSCALLKDGTLWCWGGNAFGQLGDGTTADKTTPVQVQGLGSSVTTVSAGLAHTCAIQQNGTVWCWGSNLAGQLGDGTKTDKVIPVQVLGLAAAGAALSAGGFHTCARLTNGALYCWGDNGSGQLGDGTTVGKSMPAQVQNLGASVAEVSAGGSLGGSHTCAILSGGTVWCWGANAYGQLGDGTKMDQAKPIQLAGLGANVAGVGLGSSHTCVLLKDASLRCWGRNAAGQLGDGTTTDKSAPVPVQSFGNGAGAIATGYHHSCAVRADGTLWCWGANSKGQLGDGTTASSSKPVAVVGL
jgi:alpha-tubulin suppressor-like RCC1 family protein